jgi:hypothetical protein
MFSCDIARAVSRDSLRYSRSPAASRGAVSAPLDQPQLLRGGLVAELALLDRDRPNVEFVATVELSPIASRELRSDLLTVAGMDPVVLRPSLALRGAPDRQPAAAGVRERTGTAQAQLRLAVLSNLAGAGEMTTSDR